VPNERVAVGLLVVHLAVLLTHHTAEFGNIRAEDLFGLSSSPELVAPHLGIGAQDSTGVVVQGT
jgi:hypothetical protein